MEEMACRYVRYTRIHRRINRGQQKSGGPTACSLSEGLTTLHGEQTLTRRVMLEKAFDLDTQFGTSSAAGERYLGLGRCKGQDTEGNERFRSFTICTSERNVILLNNLQCCCAGKVASMGDKGNA